MTRQQAAHRLMTLASLRDAREACTMGSDALANQQTYVLLGICGGFLLGLIVGVLA